MAEMVDFAQYLKERYEPQVKWYDRKSLMHKRWAYTMQITVILLAAVVPAFAALELKWLTITASAIVAITAGILTYCKHEELWHNYRTICETLKNEKYGYQYKLGEYQRASKPEKLFIERVESLISRENTDWSVIIKRTPKKKGE